MKNSLPSLRQERGLSRASVSERLGVHVTTVAAWERGVSFPTVPRLLSLASLLSSSIGYLLELDSQNHGFNPDAAEATLLDIWRCSNSDGRFTVSSLVRLGMDGPLTPSGSGSTGFSRRLAALCQASGTTRKYLASLLDTPVATVNDWLYSRGYPAVASLISLSGILDTSVDSLLAFDITDIALAPGPEEADLLWLWRSRTEGERDELLNLMSVIFSSGTFALPAGATALSA